MSQPELANAFGFSPTDLHTNRQGRMTEDQRRKLARMRLEASILPGIFVLASAALLYVTLRDFRSQNTTGDSTMPIFGASILVLACIAFAVFRWLRISSDLRFGDVKTISGKITLGAMETRNIGYYGFGYRLSIQGINFIIPNTARSALAEGKSYRIYYAPSSKIILSIERC